MFILYLLVAVLISLACFISETHFFCNVFFVVFNLGHKREVIVPGIPCGDRGTARFAKKA